MGPSNKVNARHPKKPTKSQMFSNVGGKNPKNIEGCWGQKSEKIEGLLEESVASSPLSSPDLCFRFRISRPSAAQQGQGEASEGVRKERGTAHRQLDVCRHMDEWMNGWREGGREGGRWMDGRAGGQAGRQTMDG